MGWTIYVDSPLQPLTGTSIPDGSCPIATVRADKFTATDIRLDAYGHPCPSNNLGTLHTPSPPQLLCLILAARGLRGYLSH